MVPCMTFLPINRRVVWMGFCVAVLSLGLTYWRIPYGTVNLPEALYGPALAMTAIACAVALWMRATRFWRGVLIFASTPPTTVMIRVIADCIADPTRHNLWPFEVAIAYGVGMPCALAGAVIGWIAARLWHGQPS
jgi:hypothetical protein